MDFSGFLGNDEVKEALSRAFESGRFPHAIVFQGETGCGKRTFSKLLAKALVCRNRDSAPCGNCPSCIRASAGSHPDIRIEEGSGATRSLSVDTIKAVTTDAYRKPEEAEVSVFLLFVENRISETAQNKLLKVIEEPPPNTVFILTCPSAEQLLPTIRSRVQSFTLRPPELEEAARCVADKRELDLDKARKLAELCSGNIGRMLGELDGGDWAKAFSVAKAMASSMAGPSGHALLEAAAPLLKDRKLFREVLSRLTLIFRDACVLRAREHGSIELGSVGQGALLGGAEEEAEVLSMLPMKRLSGLAAISEEFRQKAERNANMTLLVTDFCARLRTAAGR